MYKISLLPFLCLHTLFANTAEALEKEKNLDYIILLELGFIIFLISSFWIYRESAHKKYKEQLNQLLRELEQKNRLLQEISITDKLTGLFNRVKTDETLQTNIVMFERYGNTFSIIILDVDHFKKINDNHGHSVGDSVLKEFASILKQHIRSTDIIGRWGGEEFIIIAPETDAQGAIKLSEALRKVINTHSFAKIGRVSASFGISEISIGDTSKELINRADEALYNSKENGRDRVTSILARNSL